MTSPYVLFALPGIVVALGLFVFFDAGAQVDWLFSWLAAWSIVTFVLYGIDKGVAKTRGTRVPEIVLHAFALAGGFAGGWLGRAIFHHKTLHRSFAAVLAVSTVAWIGVAVWWYWLQ